VRQIRHTTVTSDRSPWPFALFPRPWMYNADGFRWRHVVNSYRALCLGSLVQMVVLAGCGGGGGAGVNFNSVTVTVSPAAPAISASGQVTLQATVNGTGTSTNALTWSITEQTTNCYWLDTPPTGPCPAGTIQQVTAGNFQTVTYHAPGNSGTFHVIAEWSTAFAPVITKDGTSVVTVGP